MSFAGWLEQQLRALGYMIQENEAAFNEALNKDLGRAAFETITAETNALKAEINEAIAHLDKWAKPQAVSTSCVAAFSPLACFFFPPPRRGPHPLFRLVSLPIRGSCD